MTQQERAIIIGGGIWGLSTAYHLAGDNNTQVQILERNEELFEETTSQAAGLVGQIRANPLMLKAVRYAIDLFQDFPDETGHDPGFRQNGSLLLALTSERLASFKEHVDYATSNGVQARFIDESEMAQLAPHLDTSQVEGAYFVPKDGYLDPQQCAWALGAAAEDRGAEIQTGTTVTDLYTSGGRVVGVETDHGRLDAKNVIITAGPWTNVITEMVGYTPPVVPIRHQRVTTAPISNIPHHHPVVRVTDHSCYVRPENGGYLYGFFEPDPTSYDLGELPSEFGTSDIEKPQEVMSEAQNRLSRAFPILGEAETVEHKRGLTTFSPDGKYTVGAVPGVEGLYFATGCASLGIAGSAAVGRWLANWVMEGNPGEDLSQISPERFGDKAYDREWVREASKEFYRQYYSIKAMSVTQAYSRFTDSNQG